MMQIINALMYLHCNAIVHGKVGTGSVVVMKGDLSHADAKLSDFSKCSRVKLQDGKKLKKDIVDFAALLRQVFQPQRYGFPHPELTMMFSSSKPVRLIDWKGALRGIATDGGTPFENEMGLFFGLFEDGEAGIADDQESNDGSHPENIEVAVTETAAVDQDDVRFGLGEENHPNFAAATGTPTPQLLGRRVHGGY